MGCSSFYREESFLMLSDMTECSTSQLLLSYRDSYGAQSTSHRLPDYREQRQRKKPRALRNLTTLPSQISLSLPLPSESSTSTGPASKDRDMGASIPRSSSPLSPNSKRRSLTPRASFPRSKREPDLYRTAIIACSKRSASNEPRSPSRTSATTPTSVVEATLELERLLGQIAARDNDRGHTDDAGVDVQQTWECSSHGAIAKEMWKETDTSGWL